MKALQAAFDYLNPTECGLTPNHHAILQVSPGYTLVNIKTHEVYLCCLIEPGRLWELVDVTTGHRTGFRFDADKDSRCGLPLNGFVLRPENYIVFNKAGQISKELSTKIV